MIRKLIDIRSVGTIHSVRAQTLSRFTIIYGENGRGKTTFSAILRSLTTGDPRYVEERKRVKGTDRPHVALLVEGLSRQVTFSDGHWNSTGPQIEIFDSRFVSENVYVGPVVDHSHRRALHQFVMGEEGVALACRVDQLAEEIKPVEGRLNQLEASLKGRIRGGIPLKEFLALKPDPEIDAKLKDQESALDAVRRAAQVQAHPGLDEIVLHSLDLSVLEEFLARSLEDVADDAEARTKAHVASHLDAQGEIWLNKGVRYLRENECPFCGADTSGNLLIHAYQAYFSVAYGQHRSWIRQTAQELEQPFTEAVAERIVAAITSNGLHGEFWEQLGIPTRFDSPAPNDVKAVVAELRGALAADVLRKKETPLDALEPSTRTRAAAQQLQDLAARLGEYNEQVRHANDLVARKKLATGQASLREEEAKLNRLLNQRDRHSEDTRGVCDAFDGATLEKKHKTAEKAKAKNRLDEYTEALFGRYEYRLNEHLRRSGCGYSITGTKTRYAGGKPSTEYQLLIDGQPVELAPTHTAESMPVFGNTLSDGDKSALAFGFFLTRLDLDPRLAEKVIVIDDPVGSMDCHRRSYTLQQIMRIARKCRQLIVLTHDLYFARLLWEQADHAERISLQLRKVGDVSELEPWDVEVATRGEYLDNYFTLEGFLAGNYTGDLRGVARCIRPLIESNLRMRFPGHLTLADDLGRMIAKVREADESSPLVALRAQLDELSELNYYACRYHHGAKPAAGDEPINDGELRVYVERVFPIVEGNVIAPV